MKRRARPKSNCSCNYKRTYITILLAKIDGDDEMKAICNNCEFEISGTNGKELDDNFRGHAMTFGHLKFYIVDYD